MAGIRDVFYNFNLLFAKKNKEEENKTKRKKVSISLICTVISNFLLYIDNILKVSYILKTGQMEIWQYKSI